jgi:hypothetical protein
MTDLGMSAAQLEGDGVLYAFLAFVLLIGVILTLTVLIGAVLGRRRERRAWAARAEAEWTTRSRGIEEGFRRGWHG